MATQNIFDMTDTWNSAPTTFDAIKMNVTDTSSDAASLLMELQVGAASKFSVSKGGNLVAAGSLTVNAADLANLGLTGSIAEFNTALQSSTFGTFGTTQTDDAVVRADGTAGLLQTTGVIIDDSDNITGVVALTATGTVTGPSGTWDAGGMDIATTDSYAIASTDVLTATTLGTAVVNSSLTNLGTLTTVTVDDITVNANAITSGGASSMTIVPTGGQSLVLDGALDIDGAVMGYTGAFTVTGTLISTDTITGPSGTWDSGGMDIATADTYAINSTDVLNATTLGAAVVNSTLGNVGPVLAIPNTGATAGQLTLEEPSGDSVVTLTVPALAGNYTLTLPIDDGDNTEVLSTNGSGVLSWVANGGGAGDVTAAANMTDNTLLKGDGGVKGIQDSGIVVDDSDNVSAIGTLGTTALNSIIQASANSGILLSTGYSLTGSDATNMIDLAGTWNTTGIPTAIKLNITDTASDDEGLLMDLQVGAASKALFDKDGFLQLGPTAFTNFVGMSTQSLVIGRTGTWQTNKAQLSGGSFTVWNATTKRLRFSSSVQQMYSDFKYKWTNGTSADGTFDVGFQRDGVGALAHLFGTTAQIVRIYDTHTSATDFHRMALESANTSLTSVSGATVTASSIIPAGAVVMGVTTKIEVALGDGNGTTGFGVGLAADPNQFGDQAAITENATTDNTDWTATTIQCFNAATDIIITAATGDFDGTGTIHVKVFYIIGEAD